MNEKVDLVESESQGPDFVDLGDSAVETRQTAPTPYYSDHTYGVGYTPGREG